MAASRLNIALIIATIAGAVVGSQGAPPVRPASVQSLRLYVLDGGVLESDPGRYRLKLEEVATTQLSIVAYLIVHPRGTLLWDTGAIADDSWTPTGKPVRRRLVLSNGEDRHVTITTPLKTQIAAAGYAPAGIDYLAFSHYHWDHVANANDFPGAMWLVREAERAAMLPAPVPAPPQPSNFAMLRHSRTTLITTDDHDLFGDGAVVIKSSPGHTPGHQLMYLKLARTGGVVLSGDLYHYPEERTLNRLPVADFNEDQTRRSRQALETFLTQSRARLWIQHDLVAHRKLLKAPRYYD